MELETLPDRIEKAGSAVRDALQAHLNALLAFRSADRILREKQRGLLLTYAYEPKAMGHNEVTREAWLTTNVEPEYTAMNAAEDALLITEADLQIARNAFDSLRLEVDALTAIYSPLNRR